MKHRTHRQAVAYTDGSCIGNPGPGGWGVHLELPDGRVIELGGGELRTTNNRMELRAAIEAVRATRDAESVTIVTDSTYVRNGVTRWVAVWKGTGWQTKAKRPVENQELWTALDALADERVTWQWTRAHIGTPGNERCDQIARWFASSIARLQPSEDSDPPQRPTSGGAGPGSGAWYLSLVDGVLARHARWADCESRVRGVRGARFRKVRGHDEERSVVADWGLTEADLMGIEAP